MLRDEQRAEAAKLKNAPLKEKASYFWSYYKVPVIVVILAVPFILWVILTIMHSDMDYLQIIITDQMGDTLSTEFIENTYNTNVENPVSINFDTSLELADRTVTETNALNYEKLLALYQSKTIDVFIAPESVFQHYGAEGMFTSLDTLLPEDVFQELDAEGRILYVTLTDYSEDNSENNSGDASENDSGDNSESDSKDNSESDSGDNSENDSGDNSENDSGDESGPASEKEPVVVAAGLYVNDTELAADSGMNITDACIGITYNTTRPQEALEFLKLYL